MLLASCTTVLLNALQQRRLHFASNAVELAHPSLNSSAVDRCGAGLARPMVQELTTCGAGLARPLQQEQLKCGAGLARPLKQEQPKGGAGLARSLKQE